MPRLLHVFGMLVLLPIAARAQDENAVFLTVPKNNVEHERIVRAALPQAPADLKMTAELRASVDLVARYHVYKLAPVDRAIRDNPKVMSGAVEITESWIRSIFPAKKDQVLHTDVQKAFVQAMLKDLETLLKNPQQFPIVRVNAARLLSRLARESVDEETASLCVKVIADTQQVDGAKYYACQGLKELMLRAPRPGPAIKDAKRRMDVVTTLVAFVERKPPFMVNTLNEEEGLRVVRREGIRALAETREAIVAGVPNGHAALCLCRVVGKDASLSPEPRLDEQVEAVIGLGRLPPDAQKEFQSGYAAHVIGNFVYRFALAHRERKNNRDPWRVFAAKMDDALKEMARAYNEPATTSVQNLAAPILDSIVRNMNAIADPLDNWLKNNPPAQRSVYKSAEKSVVTPKPVMGE